MANTKLCEAKQSPEQSQEFDFNTKATSIKTQLSIQTAKTF